MGSLFTGHAPSRHRAGEVLRDDAGAIVAVDFLKTPTEMTAYVSEIIAGTHSDNVIEAGAGNDQIYGEGGKI